MNEKLTETLYKKSILSVIFKYLTTEDVIKLLSINKEMNKNIKDLIETDIKNNKIFDYYTEINSIKKLENINLIKFLFLIKKGISVLSIPVELFYLVFPKIKNFKFPKDIAINFEKSKIDIKLEIDFLTLEKTKFLQDKFSNFLKDLKIKDFKIENYRENNFFDILFLTQMFKYTNNYYINSLQIGGEFENDESFLDLLFYILPNLEYPEKIIFDKIILRSGNIYKNELFFSFLLKVKNFYHYGNYIKYFQINIENPKEILENEFLKAFLTFDNTDTIKFLMSFNNKMICQRLSIKENFFNFNNTNITDNLNILEIENEAKINLIYFKSLCEININKTFKNTTDLIIVRTNFENATSKLLGNFFKYINKWFPNLKKLTLRNLSIKLIKYQTKNLDEIIKDNIDLSQKNTLTKKIEFGKISIEFKNVSIYE